VAHFLVLEDSPDNMKLFAAILGLSGHRVTGLPDGEGMLAAVAADPPDAVLMDIQLPGRDGFTLLSELRAAGHGMPVVALTAHAMAGDRERALEAGFTGYITKPIDVMAFGDQVGTVLPPQAGTDLAGLGVDEGVTPHGAQGDQP
jgi:two-component system, cell cycle response regulator DivK